MAGKEKSTDNSKRPIIIKKIKKGGGGGHHGGAWKVAYADFVTAMMAFFLLLWLITQVPQEKLTGIADYFTPTVGVRENSGADLQGSIGNQDIGMKDKPASAPGVVFGAPPTEGPLVKAPEANDVIEVDNDDADKLNLSETEAEKIESELEKKRFEDVRAEIENAVQQDANLAAFKQNLKIDQTEEGLRIQITDLEGVSMFELGSSNLRGEVQPLLAKLTDIISKVDNKVAIIGHTDSKAYKGVRTNWDLSSERANASRAFLTSSGLEDNRIFRIEGRADKEHFDENPESPKNRRISIILLKKSITEKSLVD